MQPSFELEGPNGFLPPKSKEDMTSEAQPMINQSDHVGTVAANPTSGSTGPAGQALWTDNSSSAHTGKKFSAAGSKSWASNKVIQCAVLLIIVALIAILCSVFLKPQMYFSHLGKPQPSQVSEANE